MSDSHATERARRLTQIVTEAQRSQRIPAIAAAAYARGELTWSHAIGLADVERDIDASADTQFRIGSMTKTFTAVVIMQLRDEDKLRLDDPASRHVDIELGEDVTLRRLLAHNAGLRNNPPGADWRTSAFPSTASVISALTPADQVLPPATRMHYSNTAFTVLEQVIIACDGRSYEDAVGARVLEPLGLRRTTWSREEPSARGYFVDPYQDIVHRDADDLDLQCMTAAGQLWSTVGDMATFASALVDEDSDVLSARSRQEMQVVQIISDLDDWKEAWALGLMAFRQRGLRLIGHGGSLNGHLGIYMVDPQSTIGIVVMVNSGAVDIVGLGLSLAETATELASEHLPAWRPAAPAPPEAAELLGRWWMGHGEVVMRWDDGQLMAAAAEATSRKQADTFTRESPDRWRSDRGETLIVVRDAHGAIERLEWSSYPATRNPAVFRR